MTPDKPVFQANKTVLQPNKNLVTNLEAEAEFTILGKDARACLDQIVLLLKKVAATPEEYGLVSVTDESDATVKYIDTYHDVISGDRDPQKSLAFLKNQAVMRHRHKPDFNGMAGDKAGTNLFSVKGASHSFSGGEKVRLASQVYLQDGAIDISHADEKGPKAEEANSGTCAASSPAPTTNGTARHATRSRGSSSMR